MTAIKDEITPPEESCISVEEHMFELEIEEDEEGISGDHHVNESCIKQWFQLSSTLDRFCFLIYFINSYFQHSIFYIIVYPRFAFSNLKDNFGLLLLDVWFHWKFHYT